MNLLESIAGSLPNIFDLGSIIALFLIYKFGEKRKHKFFENFLSNKISFTFLFFILNKLLINSLFILLLISASFRKRIVPTIPIKFLKKDISVILHS